MVDHLAMRKAYLSALNEEYMGFCNSCKMPYITNSGEIEILHISDVVYNIWFCDDCSFS